MKKINILICSLVLASGLFGAQMMDVQNTDVTLEAASANRTDYFYDSKGYLVKAKKYKNGKLTNVYEYYPKTKKGTHGDHVKFRFDIDKNGYITNAYKYTDKTKKLDTKYYYKAKTKYGKHADRITKKVKYNSSSSYKSYSVSACSTSGARKANAKVDVGYDSSYANRKYYAYTNKYSQLTKVTANSIVLQNDKKEPVKSSGRYCSDEAKVKGTESSKYDEGHVIADSLGGVSNAYNITPQKSSVNRSGGAQYKLEEQIRKYEQSGKQVTDFVMNITYPNTKTMTPSKYSYSYKVDGKKVSGSFAN